MSTCKLKAAARVVRAYANAVAGLRRSIAPTNEEIAAFERSRIVADIREFFEQAKRQPAPSDVPRPTPPFKPLSRDEFARHASLIDVCERAAQSLNTHQSTY